MLQSFAVFCDAAVLQWSYAVAHCILLFYRFAGWSACCLTPLHLQYTSYSVL